MPVQFATTWTTLTLATDGTLADLRVPPAKESLAAVGAGPILELVLGGTSHLVQSVSLEAGVLTATFDDGRATVRLGVEEVGGAIVFRVRELTPADADALRLRFTLAPLDEIDPALNGIHDPRVVVCLRSLDAITRCDYQTLTGAIPRLGVEWTDVHGIVGGAAALVAAPRPVFFDVVGALQVAEGLPSPRFDGVAARASATARKSYLFLTLYRPGDLPKLLEYARVGEFGLVLLQRGLWRKSEGTYGLDPALWPGGLPEFRAFCDDVHAAGLGVGLHFYGPSISLDDPLVTPVPKDGLFAWTCPPLAFGVGAADTVLVLADAPVLPLPAAGGFPGRYLQMGSEIVQYAATSLGPPFTFTGLTRGALGTTAAAHAAGSTPRHLATLYDLFLVDPDGPLVSTLAENLGQIVNAADIDLVYFDGTGGIPTSEQFQDWYYVNRLLPAHYAAFDHPVLVQTGMGPGRQLDWHVVPRSASADGHGDIKWYLDQRTPAIETIRRGLSVPDVGWYGFDAGRPPDYLEYVCAKCLGWGCGISVQTFKGQLESDSRARETMEMIGRYERCKRAGELPEAILEALLVPGQDFQLLDDDAGSFHLFTARLEAARDVRTLSGGTHSWSVFNPESASRPLGVEITRGDAVEADADFTAPGVKTVELFHDVAPYVPDAENDTARLVNRVEKVMNPIGPARMGVQHDLAVVQDAAVGGDCAELTATNTSKVIGWCAVGRVFDEPIDLTGQEAIGLWMKGDESGVEVVLELYDESDRRVRFPLPVFFDGWRFHAQAIREPTGFDATQVKALVLTVANVPPESTVSLRFVLLRATPGVRAAADLTGVTLRIGSRTITLPAPLPAGGTARVDGLGRLTIWPGGMEAGQTWTLPDGPLVLAPGTTPVAFGAAGPAPYPGDVAVRLSHLARIHPE